MSNVGVFFVWIPLSVTFPLTLDIFLLAQVLYV